MEDKRKSVLIDEELHERLKELATKSGISMKNLTEMGVELIIKRIQIPIIEE